MSISLLCYLKATSKFHSIDSVLRDIFYLRDSSKPNFSQHFSLYLKLMMNFYSTATVWSLVFYVALSFKKLSFHTRRFVCLVLWLKKRYMQFACMPSQDLSKVPFIFSCILPDTFWMFARFNGSLSKIYENITSISCCYFKSLILSLSHTENLFWYN